MQHEAMLVGYARCSTDEQDLQAQRNSLASLGVSPDRIYFDHGRSGTSRDRPGLREAMAALRPADTLVVTKLDRLGRNIRDLSDIASELEERGVGLSFGGNIYDPKDPMSKMFFSMLSVFAAFEADLLSARTKEGMAVARARGRLKGRQPKLSPAQQKLVRQLMVKGEQTPSEIGELFGVSRQTVYRIAKAREENAA